MLIVLPKGRLLKKIKTLLDEVGISFDDSSRKLVMDTSRKDIKVAILRSWDIPKFVNKGICLLYTSPSPRDQLTSRMPSSA